MGWGETRNSFFFPIASCDYIWAPIQHGQQPSVADVESCAYSQHKHTCRLHETHCFCKMQHTYRAERSCYDKVKELGEPGATNSGSSESLAQQSLGALTEWQNKPWERREPGTTLSGLTDTDTTKPGSSVSRAQQKMRAQRAWHNKFWELRGSGTTHSGSSEGWHNTLWKLKEPITTHSGSAKSLAQQTLGAQRATV